MEKAQTRKSPSKYAANIDVSNLHPSVRSQTLNAIHALERLESSFAWTRSLFGFGAQSQPGASLK